MTGSLQDKRGTWYMVINTSTDDGKRKQTWKSTGIKVAEKRKKEAMRLMNEFMVQLNDGETVLKTSDLVSDLIAKWVEDKKHSVAINTFEGYYEWAQKHLIPYFKDKRLTITDLTAEDIDEYYKSKFASGLSANTLSKHRVIINGVCKDAIRHRLILNNPCAYVELPSKVHRYVGEPYAAEQAKKLLDVLRGDAIFLLVFIILQLGLKPIRFHDLRHTCASLMLAHEIPLKTIQEYLGHSNLSTTADCYAHLEFSAKKKALNVITETSR